MKSMKIWLVMVGLVCVVEAQGQGWMRTYGGVNLSGGINVVTATNDGGYLLVAGRDPIDAPLYLAKIDGYGEILFQKDIDLEGFTFHPSTLKSLSDGSFILAGSSGNNQAPPNTSIDPALIKISANGDKVWMERFVTQDPGEDFTSKMISTSDGGFVLAGDVIADDARAFVMKSNADGELLWFNSFYDTLAHDLFLYDVIETSDGKYISCGGKIDGADKGIIWAINLTENGDLLWSKEIGDTLESKYATCIAWTGDDNYLLVGNALKNAIPVPGNPVDIPALPPFCQKITASGTEIWLRHINELLTFNEVAEVVPDGEGGFYIYSSTYSGLMGEDLALAKIDSEANFVWNKQFWLPNYQSSIGLLKNTDGSLLLNSSSFEVSADNNAILIKTDSLGNLYTSALTGHLHHDPEPDCLPDPTEPGLSGWLVQATGNQSFATLTDPLGNFTLPVDTGSYEVTVAPPGPYWDVCNSPFQVAITEFYDTTAIDFPAQTIADCPYLTVDISAPFLRRCFDNYYSVHYCNDGTVAAEDASVEVTLDPYFTYISSSIPFTSQNGNTLTFDLGEVAVNDCGSFHITAYLSCDSTILGQTHCTSAYISPDSLCPPLPDPLWNGSSIETDVACNGDSVTFTITNVGMGDMPAPLGYIIIEDEIVLMTDEFQLENGQSTTVTVPANGSTFRLEAQQAAAHPSGFASTGATIEGCGGWMSIGLFGQWAFDDDPDPFTDVDCQANIGSYDPNDKRGFPAGLGDEHLIEPGQDLEYLIRFQNTGTDTAFKVVVVDVLPPELDLAMVRPGASSHPYTYGVTPEGWLTFTFDEIMLPDSNVNEAASHGFVRFRASQRAGLGHGNVIANTALIYFDFNAPVQTNIYRHRIGQLYPWTLVGTTPPIFHQKTQVRIVPNPLTDSALLQVEGIEPGPLQMVLTDVSGKVLRTMKVFGTGFEFQRGELLPGLYFFQIQKDGEQVGNGKLMVR